MVLTRKRGKKSIVVETPCNNNFESQHQSRNENNSVSVNDVHNKNEPSVRVTNRSRKQCITENVSSGLSEPKGKGRVRVNKTVPVAAVIGDKENALIHQKVEENCSRKGGTPKDHNESNNSVIKVDQAFVQNQSKSLVKSRDLEEDDPVIKKPKHKNVDEAKDKDLVLSEYTSDEDEGDSSNSSKQKKMKIQGKSQQATPKYTKDILSKDNSMLSDNECNTKECESVSSNKRKYHCANTANNDEEKHDQVNDSKKKGHGKNVAKSNQKQTKNSKADSLSNRSSENADNEFTGAGSKSTSRRSSRIRTKIKYVESESDNEFDTAEAGKESAPRRKYKDLSESGSEISEPISASSEESENDSPVSGEEQLVKRKKIPDKSAGKVVRPKWKAAHNTAISDKKIKRRVDLSEMDTDSIDDSVKNKIKQRQFDGLIRYFLGCEGGAKNVHIDSELLQRKMMKSNASTASSASTSSVKEELEIKRKSNNASSSGIKEESKSKMKNSDESSSESEWEEVANAEEPMALDDYNPEIPKEGVEINISVPDPRKERRKKRQKEFADYARLYLNRYKKETQVAMHKVHLLGFVAHVLQVNQILLDDLLNGIILSMLPNDFLGITTKRTTSFLLTRMVTWFRSTFTLEHKEDNRNLQDCLLESLQTKVLTSSRNYCYLFVIFGRAMKLDVRLCTAVYPITFKVKDLIPTKRQKLKVKKEEVGSDNQCTKPKGDLKTKPHVTKTKKANKEEKEEKSSKTKKNSKLVETKDKPSTSKEGTTKRRKSRISKNNISYKEDGVDGDESKNGESESDDNFEPEKPMRTKKSPPSSGGRNRKILSSDSEAETVKATGKPCIDHWAEVFINTEGKWICVDVVENIINRPYEIEVNASHQITYVLAVDNESKVKDVTKRYASGWLMQLQKLRVCSEWWDESLAPFQPPRVKREEAEDKQLDEMLLNLPMPTTIGEFKNHPLYALKRHLLKYEGLYPPDVPPLGFIRKEPIYARECVRILHSRETWKRQGRAIRLKEEPYKLVKSRPRWDKVNKKIYVPEEPVDVYGEWQTEAWISPPCVDGKVPRNEYGNVELFQPSMLPAGAVHLKLPGLNRIARKLGIDCAPAMVGFDGSASCGIIPVFDGFVACEEYEDVLVAAWDEEQVNIANREKEKYEKRVYGNWRKLIRGLLIREKIKTRYFGDDKYISKSEKAKTDTQD